MEAKQFVKINNYWYEYDKTTPINKATIIHHNGKVITNVNIENSKIVEANDFKQLNWYGTIIYNNDYLTGWLSPKGEFFGCEKGNHKEHAIYVKHTTETDLENQGYLKLTYNDMRTKILTAMLFPHITNKIPLTFAQYSYLKNSYIDNFDEVDYWYRKGRELQEKQEYIM